MAHLLDEKLVVLAAAARSLPHRPHISTLHRWRTRGVRGIRLEAILTGGVWCTSREALRRFFDATTYAATGAATADQGAPRQGLATADEAQVERDLDDRGI